MADISYIEDMCSRCGSKKRVLKTWEEEVPTMLGKPMVIKHIQVICTNNVCQAAFDATIVVDQEKRDAMKLKKQKK